MLKQLFNQLLEIPRLYKRIVSRGIDCLFIVVSVIAAFTVRDDITHWLSIELYLTIALTCIFSLMIWSKLGLYRVVIRYIDSKTLYTITVGVVISGVLMIVIGYFLNTPMPRSIPFIFVIFLLLSVSGSRLLMRGLISTNHSKSKQNVIIYGAGSSGRQLALSLQHGADYNPVAFVDDNPELHHISLSGIRVYSPSILLSLIEKQNVTKLLLAIPGSDVDRRQYLLNKFQSLPVEILIIPKLADLVNGKQRVDSLRRAEISDLLGRDPVTPIDRLFGQYIKGRNILVTGAGGSIGAELCRQIIKLGPNRLILIEASEFALYSIDKELNQIANVENQTIEILPILANVVDSKTINSVIKNGEVNTIYHAAAYKHVAIVESNVVSGLRNNVWGTKVCAEAAIEYQVENFVLVSTDKVVRPTNVMGTSKRLAELVLQALSIKATNTRFSIVRFGNVLGSSGSVVPLFKKQIEAGGPVTVTHPDVTRFFMTINEAAQLVIQAGSMGGGGNVYVLDMGNSIKINDLAHKMIKLSGYSVRDDDNPDGDIAITYTGLAPGEKLYEELLIGKDVEGTEHERIMKAREISMSWDELTQLLQALETAMASGDINRIREILLDAPLDYNPVSEIVDHLWLAEAQSIAVEPSDVVFADSENTVGNLRVV